jgi:hypothetical protein
MTKFGKMLMIFTVVSSIQALADGTAVRTVPTGRNTPVSVGTCIYTEGTTIGADTGRQRKTHDIILPVTNCVESRQYEVNVTGKSWNTKDTEIPGTSKLVYSLQTDNMMFSDAAAQSLRDSKDKATRTGAKIEVMTECLASQMQLAAQARRGNNPCR